MSTIWNTRPVVVVVVAFLATSVAGGCDQKKVEPDGGSSADAICAKIASFGSAQMSPAQRDLCAGQLQSLGPHTRACFDPCITAAKDGVDYELCKDECTSREGLAQSVCTRLASPEKISECVARLTKLQPDRSKLLCVARCLKTATTPSVDDCATTCHAP